MSNEKATAAADVSAAIPSNSPEPAAAAPKGKAAKAQDADLCIVRCEIPGDDTVINGVKFERVTPKKGAPYRVSEKVERKLAERFASIPGYSIVE